jgi:hypothetical protein
MAPMTWFLRELHMYIIIDCPYSTTLYKVTNYAEYMLIDQ